MKEMAINFFTPLFVAVCLGSPISNDYKHTTVEIFLEQGKMKEYLSDMEKLKKLKLFIQEFNLETFEFKGTYERILCEISMYETCIQKSLGEEFYKQIGD